MKTVILCGGLGTRLGEETHLKPKPMVEVGDHPILWHIMNIYSSYGFNDFVLALGYKSHIIKEYFLNFAALNSDFSVDLGQGKVEYLKQYSKDWKVTLVDTGDNSLTGGRVKRLKHILKDESSFMLTYGDGVADIDIRKLVDFHQSHGKKATVTAVRPPSRFGLLNFEGERVDSFSEKPQTEDGWINGGFFVLKSEVLDYIEGDNTVFEKGPLENLANDKELFAYKHGGFWQCMDTLRDKTYLNSLWESGDAPWRKK